MAHEIVFDLQHKQLALEAFHIPEHFANETCYFKMLGCKVIWIHKLNNKKIGSETKWHNEKKTKRKTAGS